MAEAEAMKAEAQKFVAEQKAAAEEARSMIEDFKAQEK